MKIGVIMPCQTAIEFARPAVESILRQTHRDFELVIVDDAGPADTADYLRSLTDPRVRILRNNVVRGIAASLNLALAQLQTEWVCRMDADDLALPHRLKTQMAFALDHREVVVFGTNVELLADPAVGEHSAMKVPLTHAEIAYRLLWSNALNHPTVMFRRDAVQASGGYDDSHYCSEDYDLWTRMILHHRFANLPDKLIQYRVHAAQASSQQHERKTKDTGRSRSRYQRDLLGLQSPSEFDRHQDWTPQTSLRIEDWNNWLQFLSRVQTIFQSGRLGSVDCEKLRVGRDLARRLHRVMTRARQCHLPVPPDTDRTLRLFAPFYAWTKRFGI